MPDQRLAQDFADAYKLYELAIVHRAGLLAGIDIVPVHKV
jgi:hypothetical protein